MTEAILAIDQGTTNTKALLVDLEGRIVQRASRPVDLSYPQAGWVEQDAGAIWRSVQEAVDGCLRGAGGTRPVGVAISNQRESAVVWERSTGRPAGPVVIWQCRRTSESCEALRHQGAEEMVRSRTGLTLDPLFSATKFAWLLGQVPDGRRRAENGELCVGTIDSWLLWKLTGGGAHRCDVSNASRTQLLNLETLAWDETLLDLFGVPAAALPEIRPSAGVFGETVGSGELPRGLPIASMIGDSHAALFGQGGFRPGSVKVTYGTGSSLMSRTPRLLFSRRGLSSTVAWGIVDDVAYAFEGNISSTGAALQWVSELLGIGDPAAAVDLAASVDDSEGVYVVPAFVGLGAPYWAERARGLVTGVTRGTSAAHLARAVMESIGFQVRDVFEAMSAEMGRDPEVLLADGGASQSDLLMQFQADIAGVPVLRNNATDISALGAAHLAGLALGHWSTLEELAELPRSFDRFEPRMDEEDRRRAVAGWKGAVARCLFEPVLDR